MTGKQRVTIGLALVTTLFMVRAHKAEAELANCPVGLPHEICLLDTCNEGEMHDLCMNWSYNTCRNFPSTTYLCTAPGDCPGWAVTCVVDGGN